MKILVYFRELRFGGVHTYLLSQVDYLVKQGHEVWVSYSNERTRRLFEELGARGFQTKALVRSAFRIDKDLRALWQAYRFCREQGIECVFSLTSKGGAIGRLAGFLAGTPKRVHVVQGFSFHEFTPWYKEIFVRKIEQLLACLGTQLISANDSDRDTAIRRKICKPEKITTVFNGVQVPNDDERLPEQTINNFFINEEMHPHKRLILFVGRLMEQKAPLDLIRALQYIEQDNTHLVIIGEGPLLGACRELAAQLGVSRNISFLGFREDVATWYQTCHVFVLPSLWEGLSLALLEAMSYGVCCIATDIKGNRECISDEVDGILVPPNSPEQLAAKIAMVLDNDEKRRQLGHRARQTVMQRFSETRMCEATHEILCA